MKLLYSIEVDKDHEGKVTWTLEAEEAGGGLHYYRLEKWDKEPAPEQVIAAVTEWTDLLSRANRLTLIVNNSAAEGEE